MSKDLLVVSELSKRFEPNEPPVVRDLSFSVEEGEIFALLGPSGCGKTTTLRIIAGFERPDTGTVTLEDRQLEGPHTHVPPEQRGIGLVFQDQALFPHLTVFENVRFGLKKMPREQRKDRAMEVLDMVGLKRFAERYPHELSGGQQQRIGIARALAVNPEVIVLDEPVSGLDVSVQAQILNLLADLQDELDLGYVLISHDLSVVQHVCDRVAVMYLGEIVEKGPTATVFSPPYHPYTESLLSSVPGREDSSLEERIVLEGDVPDPSNVPSGCRFHPRCPHKIGEVCEREVPEGHDNEDGTITCHLMREEYADEDD